MQFSVFSNRKFLKMQFSKDLFYAIWFKIAFFVYEIAFPNAPLLKLLPYSIELDSRTLKTYVICIKNTCKTCVL
jgi:hypothetical protein